MEGLVLQGLMDRAAWTFLGALPTDTDVSWKEGLIMVP